MSENRFQKFRKDLVVELIKDGNEAYFYKCNSFYEIFVGIFHSIDYTNFNEISNENEQKKTPLMGKYISGMYENRLTKEEINALYTIMDKIARHDVANISATRGNAYMIFEGYEYRKRKKENTPPITLYSNKPSGKDENIPRLIINQIAPRTYAILPLKNIKEVDFELSKSSFSFGVPCSVFPSYSGIGDIFFFSDVGLEFSRLNIIDVFNSHKEKVEQVDNTFCRSNLTSLRIDLFQESSFIYSVNVSEDAHAGYLRELWSSFKGRIDLSNNKWLFFEGSSSLESFK